MRLKFGENRPGLVGQADQDIDEVNEIIEACGSITPNSAVRARLEQVRAVIRQTVKTLGSQQETVDAALAQIQEVVSRGNIAQIDSYKEGAFGGTGHAFDWDVAAHQEHDVVLAGLDNVATATQVTPGWSTSPPALRTASKTTPRSAPTGNRSGQKSSGRRFEIVPKSALPS